MSKKFKPLYKKSEFNEYFRKDSEDGSVIEFVANDEYVPTTEAVSNRLEVVGYDMASTGSGSAYLSLTKPTASYDYLIRTTHFGSFEKAFNGTWEYTFENPKSVWLWGSCYSLNDGPETALPTSYKDAIEIPIESNTKISLGWEWASSGMMHSGGSA